jgi:hypothetical protein
VVDLRVNDRISRSRVEAGGNQVAVEKILQILVAGRRGHVAHIETAGLPRRLVRQRDGSLKK